MKAVAHLCVFKKIAGAEFNIKRFSLADKLKEECREYCLENYKIDPTNCNRDQKEAVRDTLVNHAKRQRMVTEGRYWLSLIDKDIKEFSSKISKTESSSIVLVSSISAFSGQSALTAYSSTKG